MSYLEIRTDNVSKVHLSEIHTLIIESTAVSITACLLSELMKRKVKVLFCDEKRNPQSELLSYYGTVDTTAKIRQQIQWDAPTKQRVWSAIIQEKIRKQSELLLRVQKNDHAEILARYATQVVTGDQTNREATAARLYFNALFGDSFIRGAADPTNAALNYGYTLLLSAFNREITALGYITQLGIFHDNMFNQFNLGCDFMEPYRPLVDKIVYDMQPQTFEKCEREKLLTVLTSQIEIDNAQHYTTTAIRIYCRSVIEALNQRDISEIKYWKYPLKKARDIKQLEDKK